MNPFRIVLSVLALAGAVGTFLPWVNVPFLGTFDGTAGSAPGWITAGLFVVSGVVAQATGPKKPVSIVVAAACALPALGAGAYALYEMLDLQRSASDIAGGNILAQALLSSASVGLGLYLVVGVGVAIPLVSGVAFAIGRGRRSPAA